MAGYRGRLRVALIALLAVTGANLAHAQKRDPPPRPWPPATSQQRLILDKLDAIERKLDALAGPQLAATFCISQGRSFALGADYIYALDIDTKLGAGWAEVLDVKARAEAKFPAVPIPSETALKAEGAHGRGFDICIELPLEMGPKDTALIAELAADINADAEDFPDRGKFQRRAHRLLNFTKRRVPGVQIRTDSDAQPSSMTVAMEMEEDDAPEDEFDRIDAAVDQLLDAGLRGSETGALGVLRNDWVRDLVAASEGVPSDIRVLVDEPERFFDVITEIAGNGTDNLPCERFRLDAALRSSIPGLDQLCDRLESLPDMALVEQVLSGDLIADLFEALDTLTITSTASQVSTSTRSRFCSTVIGRRPRFDSFCGR
jgi:hypothetical protein